jgi:hydrogenase maturation protein HypF
MAQQVTAPPASHTHPETKGARIHIDGIVQGVGFRPFVYGLAGRLGLRGWVRNTSAGVDIEVEGTQDSLAGFVDGLRLEAPPLAHIDSIWVDAMAPSGYMDFEIIASQPLEAGFQPISPDVSMCPDCRRELLDPDDRRYRYPFINCTNCGPRFTIIKDIPYDRPLTTMAEFDMCPACQAEYNDPLDRRFHAQPVACPECGPHIWCQINGQRRADGDDALRMARSVLRKGSIMAVKGLGGFHLACDATNAEAVQTLRQRKGRVDKPFALMMADLDAVRRHCFLSPEEAELLESRQRPIVVLDRLPDSSLAESLAPGQWTVGVMLPYTPLHVLLLEPEPGFPDALVMTSGNLSEEPIATDNEEALGRLSQLADAFLLHNRDIETRCDDSVALVAAKGPYLIRRSRGYAPAPLPLPIDMPPVLATGAELKNTFCLTRDRYAFLSHHIGDLENYETLEAFETGISHYERLFRVTPELVSYDLHPDYLATRYARALAETGLPSIGVQHHHAHVAAGMADAGLDGSSKVLGISFDGTGYGDDGLIWGGEVLWADYLGYERLFHLKPFPMPGGDAAVRQPWRLALGLLHQLGVDWDPALSPVSHASELERKILAQQLAQGVNTPMTTSMGRLFDAVASLAGLRHEMNYEGQAAIELEAIANPSESGAYPLAIGEDGEIDPGPLVSAILDDLRAIVPAAAISARFHHGLSDMVAEVSLRARRSHGAQTVVLSGGVWQNRLLLERVAPDLARREFDVIVHRQVPANDGGLALGQAVIAGARAVAGLVPGYGR